jgi:hypothetical protein
VPGEELGAAEKYAMHSKTCELAGKPKILDPPSETFHYETLKQK